MPNTLTQAEIDAVLKLPADVRYEYFIKQIVDERRVWGLVLDEEWSLVTDGDQVCLALWSHEAFASRCALDSWEGAQPQSLGLDQFKELLEKLSVKDIKVAVFITPDAQGLVAEPEDLWNSFWQCLKAELERY